MMKRRPFLAGLTALGVGGLMSFQQKEKNQRLNASDEIAKPNEIWQEEAGYVPQIIKQLDNNFISFVWYEDASAEITDKKSGTKWTMSPVAYQEEDTIERGHVWVRQERSSCEQYPGRFRGTAVGNDIKFLVIGFGKTIKGSFICNVKLEGEFLTFQIKTIDETLPNLMFPTFIESDMLVLPMGVGRLIRKPLPSRYYHTFFSHMNMRWFGGLKKDGKNGWMAIFDENFENGGVMAAELAVVPAWQKSLGKWESSRTIKYTFTSNGYVGQAKTYRKFAQEKGFFKTLETKIKETPALKGMVGGRIISIVGAWPAKRADIAEDKLKPKEEYLKDANGKVVVLNKFNTMEESIKKCKDAGMKGGIVNVRGWGNGGYDYGHPDIWPPDPELGTIDELKKVCATKDPFAVVLHDNYQDTYEHNPSFPKGVNRRKNGEPLLGGYWAPGQSYIMNSNASIEFAKRNWEQIKVLNTKGMFIDTITAMQMYESFEPGNTQTRKQDLERKIELIKFFKSKGQLFGSEESADFGIPVTDWMECRHGRVPGESIPLWPLVFHDCIMMGRYQSLSDSLPGANEKKGSYPTWFCDMLWGYFMLYWAHSAEDDKMQPDCIKNTKQVDEWFGQIATAEMTNHEFLADDFSVERTTYGNGKSITINFSNTEKTIDGTSLKPYGYLIKG